VRKINTPPGTKFGRLTVIEEAAPANRGQRQLACQCKCGDKKTAKLSHLTSGAISSCGCLRKELTAKRSTKHGEARRGAKSPEWQIWTGITKRCLSPTNLQYRYYGARGISICRRWRKFELFIMDVKKEIGRRPSNRSLDRINNNRGYEPGNIRWATRMEQSRNRRNNILITINSTTRTLSEWVEVSGQPQRYKTIWRRLKSGIPAQTAIFSRVLT
jgi:hypothetical protein